MTEQTREWVSRVIGEGLDRSKGLDHYNAEHPTGLIVKEFAELERQLAEARAEVERLRPAAEAWEAQEAWRVHDGRDQVGLAKLYQRRNDAAARARAAKETP